MPTDSAFALRSFRRSPGWAFVTLLTIALGIGASTAVFSVANTFLIRPLPYRDASRVYAFSLEDTFQGEPWTRSMSATVERELLGNARTIEATAPYSGVTDQAHDRILTWRNAVMLREYRCRGVRRP